MADSEPTAPVSEAAPEAEAPTVDPILAQFQARAAELGFGEDTEADADGADEVEASDAEPAPELDEQTEEEAPPDEDTTSRGVRRRLAAAKKLRDEQRTFSEERDKWNEENSERVERADNFEKLRAEAKFDAMPLLTSLELEKEAELRLARQIYYKHNPENVDPSVRAEMEGLANETRLRKLEEKPEPQEETPEEPEAQSPELQEYVQKYKTQITQFAANIDSEKFPHSAEYAKENFADLTEGMFNAARQSAVDRKNAGKADLSPEESLGLVEAYLASLKAPTQTKTEPTETTPTQKKKAAMRNQATALRPSETSTDNLSYEETVKRARENFNKALRGG